MRIRRIRLVLPPRLRHGADGEARRIADAVAGALSKESGAVGSLRVEIHGGGRTGNHMAHDIAGATTRAARAVGRRGD